MAKFCMKCGNANVDSASNCARCGCSLGGGMEDASHMAPQAPENINAPQGESSGCLGVFGTILIIGIVIIIAVSAFGGNDSEDAYVDNSDTSNIGDTNTQESGSALTIRDLMFPEIIGTPKTSIYQLLGNSPDRSSGNQDNYDHLDLSDIGKDDGKSNASIFYDSFSNVRAVNLYLCTSLQAVDDVLTVYKEYGYECVEKEVVAHDDDLEDAYVEVNSIAEACDYLKGQQHSEVIVRYEFQIDDVTIYVHAEISSDLDEQISMSSNLGYLSITIK